MRPLPLRWCDRRMITVERLTKRYGGFTAVDDVSFTVRPGRVTGFLGPNGAGKSTAMRMMCGLTVPTAGTATILGKPYAALPNPARHVGVLLDASAQHAGRTGREVLTLAAIMTGANRTRVDQMLDLVGLTPKEAGRRVRNYSLGMRQRLGIAAALLGDPEVILLDEPANGLDPEGIVWIRTLLRGLAADGRTVLVSSHLMNETASFADHLVILGRGRLLADTPVREFIDARVQPEVRVRSSDTAALGALLARHGHDAVRHPDGAWTVRHTRAEELGRLLAQEGVPVLELAAHEGTLEQAYLDLTAAEAEFTAQSQEV